jgi:DNA-binding transcriptional ArsR family regulator
MVSNGGTLIFSRTCPHRHPPSRITFPPVMVLSSAVSSISSGASAVIKAFAGAGRQGRMAPPRSARQISKSYLTDQLTTELFPVFNLQVTHGCLTMQTDPLSAKFFALADPTRRAILARLSEGEASVNELAEPFDMSLPAVSKHLKVLEKAGFISRGKEAQWRPARLEPMAMKSIADWLEYYRRFWESSFDRLDGYLKKIQKGDAGGPEN